MSTTVSVWQRARGDTASVFRTIRFRLFEVGIGAALTIFVLLWTPPPWMPPLAEDWVRTVYQVLVPLGGVLAGLLGVLLVALFSAPYRQRNEARERVGVLEKERIPCIAVKPRAGRRQYGSEHEYLLWAELLVTNTSPSQSLSNVEVRLVRCQDVIFKEDSQGDYWLRPDYPAAWNPTSVYWSQRDASAHEIHVSLGPGGSKSALVAAQNNPNSSTLIFNSITSPQRVEPAKVDIEITSLESPPLKRSFYIECTPNWFSGPKAMMVFVDWDDWASSQSNAPSIPDTGGCQSE